MYDTAGQHSQSKPFYPLICSLYFLFNSLFYFFHSPASYTFLHNIHTFSRSHVSTFPRSCVPVFLCSCVPMFPRSFVPMFPRSYSCTAVQYSTVQSTVRSTSTAARHTWSKGRRGATLSFIKKRKKGIESMFDWKPPYSISSRIYHHAHARSIQSSCMYSTNIRVIETTNL